MARWAEDGSVAKPRGGKGTVFVRCLTSKQIETDLSQLLNSPLPDGHKRTRNRDLLSQVKRHRPEYHISGGSCQNSGVSEKQH